jgi:Domain of unknown function (DUF4384)
MLNQSVLGVVRSRGIAVIVAVTAAVISASCSVIAPVKLSKEAAFLERAAVENRPVLLPTRSVSNFTPAVMCMDKLLSDANLGTVYITSKSLSDPTGKLAVGMKDMAITTLLRMSRVSNTFRIVDFEMDAVRQDTVQTLTNLLLPSGQLDIKRPQLYLSGGVAFTDASILSKRRNIGVSGRSSTSSNPTAEGDLGYSNDTLASAVGLDLHLGDFNTRTLLPGLESSNEIVLANGGQAIDLGGRIKKFGFQFELSNNAQQGNGNGLRALIELGVIELIGKWARVPYWQCLQIEQVSPDLQRQIYDWYEESTTAERVKLAKRALMHGAYMKDDTSDAVTPEFRGALMRWQRDQGLVPQGSVTFESYAKLMERSVDMDDKGQFKRIGFAIKEDEQRLIAPASLAAVPISIAVSLNKREGVYATGEVVTVRAVPSQSGYLNCFYQDSNGAISGIFPNPQQPQAWVEAGRAVMIPDVNSPSQLFSIEASDPGTQSVACILSGNDLKPVLPEVWRGPALLPIANIRTLSAVSEVYGAAASAAKTSVANAAANWRVVARPQAAAATTTSPTIAPKK